MVVAFIVILTVHCPVVLAFSLARLRSTFACLFATLLTSLMTFREEGIEYTCQCLPPEGFVEIPNPFTEGFHEEGFE